MDYMGVALVYPLFAYMLFDPSLKFLPASASAGTRGLWLGFLIALHPFLQFLCAPLFGALSDRKGRKRLLRYTMGLGLVGYSAAILACLFQSLFLLALFRICVGISGGNCSIISAVVADLSTPETKAKNYGLLNMAFGAGFTLGPFLSGFLAQRIHLCAPFFTALLFVSLNWLLVSWKLKETRPLKNDGKIGVFTAFSQLKQAVFMPELRFLFLSLLIFSFGWSFFTEFAGLYLIDRYQFTPNSIGLYYAYNGFFYAVSAGCLIYPFIRRLKTEKILIYSMICSGLYLAILGVIDQSYLLWLYLPLLQFFLSFVYPAICAAISNRVSEERQGEVMGMYQGIIALALAVTPFCGGGLAGNHSFSIIFLSGFFMVAAAGVLLFLKDKVPILNAD
jgi:DHA1 family tetracycline resistance protein-like MFS transporter